MTPPAPVPPAVQAALDNAPCGLLRTGDFGVIVRANRTMCQWLQYAPEELVGRKLADFLTVGGRIFHQTHLQPLMQMQGSVSEVKLEFVRRDGEAIPVVLNAQRIEEDGASFSDIAAFVARDRDKYERELLLARRRLEALVTEGEARRAEAQDRALIAEQMVGIVSHDLRNPLQTIQMGTILLMRGEATPHQLGVLGRILRAGERAHRLIAELLDFTQARLGQGLRLQRKSMDLHQVVADVLDELAQAYAGRRLAHVREGDGACVADADRVAQLVGNLVANALAYGEPGAPVTVTTRIAPPHFSVSVHNRGAPIPLDAQARMFEPMVRGASETGATRSVGLGLFIVSEIAKAHGGHVEVASSAGAGTTFSATFPCQE